MKDTQLMKKSLPLCVAALLVPSMAVSQVIVNDSWADGDRFKTNTEGELDADWWSSNHSGGNSVEVETDALGLISGASGRGIHATFAPQTLEIGDTLVVTYTFTTPATVGTDRGGAFKIALNDFNDAGLAFDLDSLSTTPNPLYTSLPGYLVEFDVNNSDASDDTGIRKHIVPNTSGRYLSTTTEWTSLGSSADADYAILPNTEYVGVISLTRTNTDSMQIFGSLSQDGVRLDSFTATDTGAIANNIGMLGFWSNSNTFGSTNFNGDPDNGITFSNVTIEMNPVVNITLGINDSFADGDRAATEGQDAAWWSSNSTAGNSVEASIGELGLVTGTSGRGMHGTFNPVTLEIGETLVATMTFETPATVGTAKSGALKFALMDFNNAGLAADLLSTSMAGSENPLYTNLPGYMVDFDVNLTGTNLGKDDTSIRKHTTPNTTGRFLGTTGEWTLLGNSGDVGYAFEANTEYTVVMSVKRTADESVDIFSSLSKGAILLDSYSATDSVDIANNYGMLGVWVNSNTFGSTNLSGNPDNGITFSNVNIGVVQIPVEPEPTGPQITSIVRDVNAETVTIEWDAVAGTTYFIFASDDLESFEDELADELATSSTATFTETGVTADKRFYRVVPLVEE